MLDCVNVVVIPIPSTYGRCRISGDAKFTSSKGDKLYTKGTQLSLISEPSEHHDFKYYAKNGNIVSNKQTFDIVASDNATYTANFDIATYEVSLSANNEEWYNSLTGAGQYKYGDIVTLNAVPAEGCTFVSWTSNGEVLSEEQTYSFTIEGNMDIIANFASDAPQHQYTTINGVQWANEFLSDEQGNVKFYQWGDTSGYTASQVGTDKVFNWSSYKYANGDHNKLTKYCPSNKSTYWDGTGDPDNLTPLETIDDAATTEWGSNWKIPSYNELNSLLDTEHVSVEHNVEIPGLSILGTKFTDIATQESIIFPYYGYANGSSVYDEGGRCYYWSSSLYESSPDNVCGLRVYGGKVDASMSYLSRCGGYVVRPVHIQNLPENN